MKIRFVNAVCILALILASACKSDNASQLKDKEMMITEKKNIGSKLALYPMPVTVVGAEVNGKVNWLLVAHVGIIGHDRILISMSDKHYTNQGIIESKKLSVNLVDRKMLPKADYVGSVSGANTDKSHEFSFHWGENGTPVIDASPLTMECNVVDIYKSDGFDNFICSIANTYAAPEVLDDNGKLDYTRLKPVLFEFPTYSYIASGEVIGKCLKLDKEPSMCAKEPIAADGIVRLSKSLSAVSRRVYEIRNRGGRSFPPNGTGCAHHVCRWRKGESLQDNHPRNLCKQGGLRKAYCLGTLPKVQAGDVAHGQVAGIV